MRLLVFLLPAVLLTGCLVSRKHSALAESARPLAPVALLPVEVSATFSDSDEERDKLERVGNEVLDTLAKAKNGHLLGPSKVLSLLGSNGVPAVLRGGTGNEITTNAPAIEAARQLARSLGVRQVVRCRLNASRFSSGLSGGRDGIGVESTCRVYADMELLNLEPLEVTRTSSASGKAEQTKGLFMLMLPIYYGTTFGRAVDQAERTALTQLFAPESLDSDLLHQSRKGKSN